MKTTQNSIFYVDLDQVPGPEIDLKEPRKGLVFAPCENERHQTRWIIERVLELDYKENEQVSSV
jgi:hypothetical protein